MSGAFDLSPKKCVHCGHAVTFFKVPASHAIALDHPYRLDYETFGGWWIHESGPAAYLRSCAFGPSLADCIDAYLKYRDAKATPDLKEAVALYLGRTDMGSTWMDDLNAAVDQAEKREPK